jgi:hypothetical protein
MDRAAHKLPLRLVPRRRSQIGKIATSVVVIVACAIYMIAALQKLHAASTVHVPALDGQWPHWRPYVIGIPIILYAAWHIVRAVAKLLPGSPYYYLHIAADGLEVASLFATNRFPWSKLGAFSVCERIRSRRYGRQVDYIVVSSHAGRPEPAKQGERRDPATIRIDPDEYGGKTGQEDAEELAAWFNRLRLASLREDSLVDVPPAFQDSVMPDVMAGKFGLKAARPRTVVRR